MSVVTPPGAAGAPWQSLVVAVDGTIAEALADALLARGAVSATIEDADAGTADEQPHFGEPLQPGMARDPDWHDLLNASPWPRSTVRALFDGSVQVSAALACAARDCGLERYPEPQIEPVPEEDWVARTQAQFAPIQVAERLWIVPSWHDAPDPAALNLVLDPGLAFGTGSHPTTRLSLEWLVDNLRGGERIIDYGCGSGILGIAAMRLGAVRLTGVDIDPVAVAAAAANARNNRVEGTFLEVNQPLNTTADIVVANILANPLRVLAPVLARLVRPGGKLVLAGLLDSQGDDISAVYAADFFMRAFATREGWVGLEGTRR